MAGLHHQQDAIESAFLLGTWICYVAGAALGTASKGRWELHALYFPIAALACLVLLDLVRPIASKEMQEQSAA